MVHSLSMIKGLVIRSFLSFFFVVCWLVVPPYGFAHEEYGDRSHDPGFLHIRPQAPPHNFRMTLPHLLPGSIKPGAGYILGTTFTNVWVYDKDINLDYEMLDLHMSFTYGLSEDFGFALVYDQRNFYGGILDGLVQGIHEIFGIDQNGRTDVPKGRTYLEQFDTGTIIDDMTVLDNRAINFMIQYVFIHGRNNLPAVGLTGGVRYTLEAPEGGTEKHPVDTTIALGLAKRLAQDWYTCLHLGLTRFEQTKILHLEFKKEIYTGMWALAWDVSHRTSLLAQIFHTEGTIENFAQFSHPSTELNLGVRLVTDAGGAFEFAIIENIFNYNNSPDLGFHFAYSGMF